MRCPQHLAAVEWFGRGPHECYPDRKASAAFGRYSASVDAMHVPYIVPSENGGRADVSWVSLQHATTSVSTLSANKKKKKAGDEKSPGVLLSVTGKGVAQMSAQRHSLEALDAAAHTHELEAATEAGDGSIHVHMDYKHMGVGGDDSWTPCVHSDHLISSGESWSWGLTLAPLPVEGDAFEMHRQLQSRNQHNSDHW